MGKRVSLHNKFFKQSTLDINVLKPLLTKGAQMRYLFFATICFMMISSYTSNYNKVYSEEQLPTSETARLKRYVSSQPSKYVKIVIRELDGEKFSGTTSTLEVLPGSHTIKIDFVVPGSVRPGSTKSKEMRFNAAAGGEYAFAYPSRRPYKIKIYDINTGETVSY